MVQRNTGEGFAQPHSRQAPPHDWLEALPNGWLDDPNVGPELCNTGPNTRVDPPEIPKGPIYQRASVDTLEVTVIGEWSPLFREQKTRELEQKKQLAQHGETPPELLELEAGGLVGLVQPTGWGRQGLMSLRWVLETEVGQFALADPEHETGGQVGRFSSSALGLLVHGLEGVAAAIGPVLADLGIQVQTLLVSRTDPCVDLVGVSLEPFAKAFEDGRYISRAKKSREKGRDLEAGEEYEIERAGRRVETIYLGRKSSACMLRAYDKGRELKKAAGHDPAKVAAWLASRLGDQDAPIPDCVRLECQIRREGLRRLGILTLDDLLANVAGLFRYVFQKRYEFFLKRDRTHRERSTVLPEWEQARAEVEKTFEAGPALGRLMLDWLPQPKLLIAQARGLLATLFARLGICEWSEMLDAVEHLFGPTSPGRRTKIENLAANRWGRLCALGVVNCELGAADDPPPDDESETPF